MLNPTTEQLEIIETAKTGENIAITAGAGAAKTSTCIMIAEALPKNSLYIAFNKSIADEAGSKFPFHVTCRTLHSIAYEHIVKGTKYYKKLNGFFDNKEILELLPEVNVMPYKQKFEVLDRILTFIKEFCQSDNINIVTFVIEQLKNLELNNEIEFYTTIVSRVWLSIVNLDTKTKMTHDVYLKLFHLSNPVLDYDIIYLDEAQDSNAVTLDIVLKQKAQIIIVGDKYQAIYEWRGAINAFDYIPDNFTKLTLSQSFRFGEKIASKANYILNTQNADLQIEGKGTKTNIETSAVITRTNIGLFNEIMYCFNNKLKVKVIGDLKDLFSALYTASNMKYDGDPTKRYHKYIASFGTWRELTANSQYIPELAKVVNILLTYPNIHETITKMKSIIVEDGSEDLTITTCHKAKGLEFDKVTIAGDFIPGENTNLNDWLLTDQNANLFYVAVTRAKVELVYPFEFDELFEND